MHMLITSLQVPICFVSILDFWAGQKNVFQKRNVWSACFFWWGLFIFAIHQAYVLRTKQIHQVVFHAWKGFKRGANQKCNTYLRRKRKHGVFFLANYNFDTWDGNPKKKLRISLGVSTYPQCQWILALIKSCLQGLQKRTDSIEYGLIVTGVKMGWRISLMNSFLPGMEGLHHIYNHWWKR